MALTKMGLRRAWFQAHKWIGLVLAIAIIPLSLSGAALVWHDALDKAVNPKRYAITSAKAERPIQAYVDAARSALSPGERIASMRLEPDTPVTAVAMRSPAPGAPGRPARTLVWLDPGTAKVLDKADGSSGLVRVLHQLHGSLMLPGIGRTVVGWLGVAMLVSSLSGLWLWWPTAGRWTRGLRWRRHAHFDVNLHHLFGFWIALPLAVLSLTGAWIAFPSFFAAISGERSQRGGGDRFRAQPLEHPAQTLGSLVTRARQTAPGSIVAIQWPTDRKAEWSVTLSKGERRSQVVAVNDTTGAAAVQQQGAGASNSLAATMRRIHDGDDMGWLWQITIFAGGILPAALAGTGVIMWWRARQWRGAQRLRAGRLPVSAK